MKLYYSSGSGSVKDIELDCDNAKVLIVEGFESVGKTHFINSISSTSHDVKVWDPRKIYDLSSDSTKIVPYEYRYVLNLALIDLAMNNLLTDNLVVVDRGLISGVVYSVAKGQDNNVLSLEFLNIVKELYTSGLVHNIYIKHDNKDTAYKLYDCSLNDNSVKESYDRFSGFDEYYSEHAKFDRLFSHYLKTLCGNNYTVLSSIDYNILSK